MGKKSISNSQLQDTSISSESKRTDVEQSMSSDEEKQDLRELITQEVLKVALQAELQDRKGTQDPYNQVIRSVYGFLNKMCTVKKEFYIARESAPYCFVPLLCVFSGF